MEKENQVSNATPGQQQESNVENEHGTQGQGGLGGIGGGAGSIEVQDVGIDQEVIHPNNTVTNTEDQVGQQQPTQVENQAGGNQGPVGPTQPIQITGLEDLPEGNHSGVQSTGTGVPYQPFPASPQQPSAYPHYPPMHQYPPYQPPKSQVTPPVHPEQQPPYFAYPHQNYYPYPPMYPQYPQYYSQPPLHPYYQPPPVQQSPPLPQPRYIPNPNPNPSTSAFAYQPLSQSAPVNLNINQQQPQAFPAAFNIHRLMHHKHDVPKLFGKDPKNNNKWRGPTPTDYIKSIEQIIKDDNIVNEWEKLTVARKNIDVNSPAYKMTTTLECFKEATTWDSFKDKLLTLLHTKGTQSVFLNYLQLNQFKWSPEMDFLSYWTKLQSLISDLIDSSIHLHDERYSEVHRNQLAFSHLYSQANEHVRGLLDEHYDHKMDTEKMIKKLHEKSRNQIEYYNYTVKPRAADYKYRPTNPVNSVQHVDYSPIDQSEYSEYPINVINSQPNRSASPARSSYSNSSYQYQNRQNFSSRPSFNRNQNHRATQGYNRRQNFNNNNSYNSQSYTYRPNNFSRRSPNTFYNSNSNYSNSRAYSPAPSRAATASLNPYNLPFCSRCQKLGHFYNECKYPYFCSYCSQSHKQGSQEACRGTQYDPYSSENIKRIGEVTVRGMSFYTNREQRGASSGRRAQSNSPRPRNNNRPNTRQSRGRNRSGKNQNSNRSNRNSIVSNVQQQQRSNQNNAASETASVAESESNMYPISHQNFRV